MMKELSETHLKDIKNLEIKEITKLKDLNDEMNGQTKIVRGFVHSKRKMGNMLFMILRQGNSKL